MGIRNNGFQTDFGRDSVKLPKLEEHCHNFHTRSNLSVHRLLWSLPHYHPPTRFLLLSLLQKHPLIRQHHSFHPFPSSHNCTWIHNALSVPPFPAPHPRSGKVQRIHARKKKNAFQIKQRNKRAVLHNAKAQQ